MTYIFFNIEEERNSYSKCIESYQVGLNQIESDQSEQVKFRTDLDSHIIIGVHYNFKIRFKNK